MQTILLTLALGHVTADCRARVVGLGLCLVRTVPGHGIWSAIACSAVAIYRFNRAFRSACEDICADLVESPNVL